MHTSNEGKLVPVGVKAGEPEHRDECLSEVERAANTAMAVCCSGSRSAKLVLDL